MDLSKKDRLKGILLFLYLAFFAFGQILGVRITFLGRPVPLFFCDVIAGMFGILVFFEKGSFPKFWFQIKNFIWVTIFSLLFSLTIFKPFEVLTGALYGVRIVAYALFFVGIFRLVRKSQKIKAFLFAAILYISLFIAIFGLFQYVFYPDVRPFTVWGWDDHLFRLVGTFMDPGFTSIFLVFGFLVTLAQFLLTRKKRYLFSLGIFLLSLALTYSRAGYVALFAGVGTFLLARKNLKKIFMVLIAFAAIVLLIPSFGSEGVRLGRTKSIFARLESYSQAITIFSKSPVFGVGFNNLCIAKEKFLGQPRNFESHACSGVESSFLLILATTGIFGFVSFSYLIFMVFRLVPKDIYGLTFSSCLVALLFHSLFVNSLFYPWVMGYLGILLGVSFKEKN